MDDIKHILVTGATSGIGKALTLFLLKDPNNYVYGIGRDSKKIENCLDKNNFCFISCDLSETNEIANIFDEELSGIKFSGFVHCAGMEETLPISLYTPNKVRDIFSINVFSAFEILRFLSKKKHSIDNASFILVASVMSEFGQAGKSGYCASKAAIVGLTNALSLELAKRNIRVNSISPGIVETPLTEKLFQQLDNESISRIRNMHPIGFGTTEDIVHLLDFLLSNNSKWITGQNIKIDGGYSTQ